MPHGLSATYGGMAHSVVELTVALVNLASGGRHGESCARPGAASRVAAWELLVWLPSVRWFEGSADRRPGGRTAASVAMSRQSGFPLCWG
jgi:hypothetical protein